jgi:hypothetical protein
VICEEYLSIRHLSLSFEHCVVCPFSTYGIRLSLLVSSNVLLSLLEKKTNKTKTRFFLYLSFYLHSIDINRIKYIYIKITKGVYVKLVSASAPFTHAWTPEKNRLVLIIFKFNIVVQKSHNLKFREMLLTTLEH